MNSTSQVDLFEDLQPRSRLLVGFEVARKLHIPHEALIELIQAGLGPDPHPAFASGYYWFLKAAVPFWKSWAAREASDEDIRRAADIIVKDDRTRRIREFQAHDNDDPRRFLTTLFSRKPW